MTNVEPTATTGLILPGRRDDQFWLDTAHAAVRRHCGWHVAPVITETLRLDGSGTRKLLLPSQRVRRIIAATSDGVDVLDRIDWSEKGIVSLDGRWTHREGRVLITLEHGYEPSEAADVLGVIATVAERAKSPAGIVSQSVPSASVRYADVPLMQHEQTLLNPYRLNWGA